MNDKPHVPFWRTTEVLADVGQERERQDEKFGVQNHPDIEPGANPVLTRRSRAATAQAWKEANERRVDDNAVAWDGILLEEVFEALAEKDPAKIRAELIQVAAVAVSWVECIDRREVSDAAA